MASAQVGKGVPGENTLTGGVELAEQFPAWRPAPDAVPELDSLTASRAPRAARPGPGARVARYMLRRVRQLLYRVGPVAGASALFLVELFAALWRGRRRPGRAWSAWLWIPAELVPFGARVDVLRAELVAAVRCRPVRGPAGPGWCWPRATRGYAIA